MKRSLSLLLVLAAAARPAHAEIRLPALISDNMVLLQDAPAGVWGWAAPAEKVTVKLGPKTAEAVADAEGKWSVKLEGLTPGPAGEMTITGQNTVTVKNVAIGEVWLASGQSNMEFPESASSHGAEEAAKADYPQIRVFTVKANAQYEPQADCEGKWEICTPETVGHFSAVGYFFARDLYQSLQVPVGLIHSSVGGTAAECWTPTEALQAIPELEPILHGWEKLKADFPAAKEAYDAAMLKCKEAEAQARAAGQPLPPQPSLPMGGAPNGSPASLYNGMIHPLLGYGIRGAIWYQGESNAGRARQYRVLFPTLIQSWRQLWGAGEFPFLFVQLPGYQPPQEQPGESSWAALREAQAMALELPHTGMAVTIDLGEAQEIHPRNKSEVGRRLGLIAQATVYYRDMEYAGPMIGAAQAEGDKMRLTFRYSEGMKSADGGPLKGFAVAGEDRQFVWAEAEIQGDHVLLSSPKVPHPVAARYDWADNPQGNLLNSTGLPAAPFRTDDWQIPF